MHSIVPGVSFSRQKQRQNLDNRQMFSLPGSLGTCELAVTGTPFTLWALSNIVYHNTLIFRENFLYLHFHIPVQC